MFFGADSEGFAMAYRFLLAVMLWLVISVGEASSQNINNFMNLFGGMMQQAVIQAAQSEWRKIPPNEIGCIEQGLVQQGTNVQTLIQRGVTPSDPRLGQLIGNCRGQNIQQTAQPVVGQTTPPVLAQTFPYVVDGLALGGRVQLDSAAYREYQCHPSEQFPGFTLCRKRVQEKSRPGPISFTNSILHGQDGTAVYVNRYIEPATFERGEFEKEIDRLSAKYGERARVKQMPSVPGFDRHSVIAQWGKVALEALDTDSIAILASGKNVTQGLLVDYLGDFTRSAKLRLPVYRIAGGAGYLWAASSDQNGRGTLRFFASNANAYKSAAIASAHAPPSFPSVLSYDPGPGASPQLPPVEGPALERMQARLKEARAFLDDTKSFMADQNTVLSIVEIAGEAAKLQVTLDKLDDAAAVVSMNKLNGLMKPIKGFDLFLAEKRA